MFIYYRRSDMQRMLNLSDRTVTKIINDLQDASLIENIRQGITQPNKIYLLSPVIGEVTGNNYESRSADITNHDGQDLRVKTGQDYESRSADFTNQDQQGLRIKTGNIYESRSVSFTGHDGQNLRVRNSIFKQTFDGKIKSPYVNITLRNNTTIHIDPAQIIAIRIWEIDQHNWKPHKRSQTTLTTTDNVYDIKPLVHYECLDMLGADNFFICDREHVLNRHYIANVDYDTQTLTMSNGLTIWFDGRKAKQIKKLFKGVFDESKER